jgi:hypothetical protein
VGKGRIKKFFMIRRPIRSTFLKII